MENQRKRILAFIDWYAPGYKAGGGQRAFANFVEYMKEEHDFFIVTRNTDFMEQTPYPGIVSDQWIQRSPGEKVWYANAANLGLFRKLWLEVKPDMVYVNGVYSLKFSITPLLLLKTMRFRGKTIQSTYGMLAQSAIRIKSTKKKIFLTLSKHLGLFRNVTFHATSEGEQADIVRTFGPKAPILLAPHFPERRTPVCSPIQKQPGALKLISVARIAPEKNILFALQCLQTLHKSPCDVTLHLYGPIYNTSYWDECQAIIASLPAHLKVEYKGVLQGREVIDAMGNYHALLMPSRGENFGFVVLESWMAGRPVLISDQTPWRQLAQKKAGFDLPLHTIDAYTQTLQQMLQWDQLEYDTWCHGATLQAEAFMNDPELRRKNQQLFE